MHTVEAPNEFDRLGTKFRTITPAQHTAAKVAGLLYLIQMATGVFGEVYARGQLIVRGNATKTAENIIANERLFRLSIAGDLVTYLVVIVLVWALYVLLRPVNKNLVLLGVFFRLVEVAVLCVATVNSLVVLKLLSGADYLKNFDISQLHSLVMLAYSAQGLAMSVGFILVGLGSTVFAYLLLKSRSSLLLAVVTLAIMVFPGLGALGLSYMMPMGIYEVGLGLWLLIKGIQAPREAAS